MNEACCTYGLMLTSPSGAPFAMTSRIYFYSAPDAEFVCALQELIQRDPVSHGTPQSMRTTSSSYVRIVYSTMGSQMQ